MTADHTTDDIHSRRYGWGKFKPNWLQFLNTSSWYLVFAVLFILAWGISAASLGSGIPHIEKQFGLTSKKSAVLSTSMDIGSTSVVLFISYASVKYNIAKIVAVGAFLCGCGGILMSVPHYLVGPPVFDKRINNVLIDDLSNQNPNSTLPVICPLELLTTNSSNLVTRDHTDRYDTAYNIIVLGEVLRGIGTATIFGCGIAYLDINSKYPQSALLIGIAYTASPVGIVLGSLVFAYVVDHVYLDFDTADPATIPSGPNDPRWIGAWWLGFFGSAFVCLLVSIPLSGYPKYLPGIDEKEAEAKIQSEGMFRGDTARQVIKNVIVDFFDACKRLVLNAEFMAINIAIGVMTVGGFGATAFGMKYSTEMYSLSMEQASYISSGKSFMTGISFLLGGAIIRRAKLHALGIEKLAAVLLLVAGLMGVGMLARCSNVRLVGLEEPFYGENLTNGLLSQCQGHCRCQGLLYNPVCGTDNMVYYSPCHAGCTDVRNNGTDLLYINCSCISPQAADFSARPGECVKGCYGVYISTFTSFISGFCATMALSNSAIAVLRCVDQDLRGFALGIQTFISSLIGFIPSPIIIGAILDATCLVWSNSDEDESGYCQVYNREKLSYGFAFMMLTGSIISSLLFLLAIIANKRRNKKMDTKEELSKE